MSDDGTGANPDTVTISKTELLALQRGYKLQNDLWDNPEHGAAIKKAAKAVDPKLRIPEIDVAEPLLAPIRTELETVRTEKTALAERLTKLEQQREDDKALGDLQSNLSAAQRRYRLTDDGMAEVRKIMADRNIADPMAAAAYVVSEIEPAKPVSGSNFAPQDLNVLGIDGKAEEESIKSLHLDPLKWFDKAAADILSEDAEAA